MNWILDIIGWWGFLYFFWGDRLGKSITTVKSLEQIFLLRKLQPWWNIEPHFGALSFTKHQNEV